MERSQLRTFPVPPETEPEKSNRPEIEQSTNRELSQAFTHVHQRSRKATSLLLRDGLAGGLRSAPPTIACT
jgi:hypothetical protein